VAVSGVAVSGVAVSGVAVSGVAVSGVAVSGVAVSGVAVSGRISFIFPLLLSPPVPAAQENPGYPGCQGMFDTNECPSLRV
jgi:hypothetical protein